MTTATEIAIRIKEHQIAIRQRHIELTRRMELDYFSPMARDMLLVIALNLVIADLCGPWGRTRP